MDQIGRYKIFGEVGRGAMGVVYRAQDPAIGRTVAIKTIRLGDLAEPAERERLRDRLMREAQSAGILSHPGIVTIFDVGEQDGLAYISMEYVDGPTLERMISSEAPDGRFVLDVLMQTGAALDYAHRRGIVHRDIKPANIMMQERSIAKITDFGVARIVSNQLTQSGSMIGTPNYMSPEQIQGRDVDGRSDQFSLAVIAYELLTGGKPFLAESIPGLALKIVQEQPQPVHRLNPTLAWPVDTVLKRALSKDPADRYPTCSEFILALENACKPCKDWRPMAHGAAQNLPTVAAGVAPLMVAGVPERSSAGPLERPTVSRSERGSSLLAADEEDPPPRTPWLLRLARAMALVTLGAGAVALAFYAAFDVFDGGVTQPPSQVRDQTGQARDQTRDQAQNQAAEPVYEKPSAMPPVIAEEPPQEALAPVPAPQAGPVTERQIEQVQPNPVRLVTNPPGATLVLDDNPAHTCKSPCSLALSPGRHTVAASMDGHRRTLKIFQSPTEEDIFLHLERATGTLVVRSEPRGARLIVDGQPWADATPVMLTLPTGRHAIEVVHGDRREKQEVMIQESVITNLAVSLNGP